VQANAKAQPIIVVEIPRAKIGEKAISATEVRNLLAQKDFSAIEKLVPPTTFQFLETKYASGVGAIR
jgi:[citrate (pro-3S)-lyase] ligase